MLNNKFPAPQANRLDKVAVVVDAIAAGCTTAESIAEALGVVDRQGGYYANAAGSLGLASQQNNEWELTDAGEDLRSRDSYERMLLLKGIVLELEESNVLCNRGEAALSELLSSTGIGPETTSRRLECIKSWVEVATSPDIFAKSIDTEQRETISRSVGAAAKLAVKNALSRETLAKPIKSCSKCCMQLLPSGKCGECD